MLIERPCDLVEDGLGRIIRDIPFREAESRQPASPDWTLHLFPRKPRRLADLVTAGVGFCICTPVSILCLASSLGGCRVDRS